MDNKDSPSTFHKCLKALLHKGFRVEGYLFIRNSGSYGGIKTSSFSSRIVAGCFEVAAEPEKKMLISLSRDALVFKKEKHQFSKTSSSF